jgi:uncharacterized protein (TIGR03435 family)
MLQRVLIERFKLQIHSEKKLSPVYELMIAKGGPQMHPAQVNEIQADGRTTLYTGPGQLTAHAATMEDLSYSLCDTPGMDRQVVDETGLQGRYSFTLHLRSAIAQMSRQRKACQRLNRLHQSSRLSRSRSG